MKFYPKANIYKASNVTFTPNTCEAYSYGWWRFVECIGGKLVFNWYSYSNSTRKHQWKVWHLLRDLGLTLDAEIEAPKGLQDLQSSINLYESRLVDLKEAIAKPKTKAAKNAERQKQIKFYQKQIRLVHSLITQQQKQAA